MKYNTELENKKGSNLLLEGPFFRQGLLFAIFHVFHLCFLLRVARGGINRVGTDRTRDDRLNARVGQHAVFDLDVAFGGKVEQENGDDRT